LVINIASKPIKNSINTERVDEEVKDVYKPQSNSDNLPPIHKNNKYVTFSVSASKDFKMSLVKKSVNRENEIAVDTNAIK